MRWRPRRCWTRSPGSGFWTCARRPAESEEIRRYLAGDVLAGDARGWTLVQVERISLGWAKGDGRTLKNHYPKALRRCV